MTGHLFIAAKDFDEACAIGAGVAAGKLDHIEHYRTEEGAQKVADHLNRLAPARGCKVFRVPADVPPEHTVWNGDALGERIAAFMLVCGGPALVAYLWRFFA